LIAGAITYELIVYSDHDVAENPVANNDDDVIDQNDTSLGAMNQPDIFFKELFVPCPLMKKDEIIE